MILVGDFYFFLDITLEAKGGSPGLLKNFAAKSIKIKELFDLCDNWRLRNPDVKQFTFRKKHASSFVQQRLYYCFISNSLEEVITRVEISWLYQLINFQLLFQFQKAKLTFMDMVSKAPSKMLSLV